MRAFLALKLPDPVVRALSDLQMHIQVGRVPPPENLHLTLAFLDQIAEHDAVAVHTAMQKLTAGPVPLHIAGLDVFGGKRPRLLYAAATGPETLHKQVARALRGADIALARRRYRPHVTLSRLPHRLTRGEEARLARFLGENAGFALPPVEIDRFALMRSHLRPDGARYEELAQYTLTP